jgi:LysM repeat protein
MRAVGESGLREPEMSDAGERPADDVVRTICPYLGTGEGWRLAVPDRVHRCLAVAPAAPLTLEKQRRLCLGSGHATCATYVAARAAADELRDGRDADTGTRTRARDVRPRWPVPRTVATVLDAGRGSLDIGSVAREPATSQVLLVLLALVAFGVLIAVRLGGGAPARVAADASPPASIQAFGPHETPAATAGPSRPPLASSTPVAPATPPPTPTPSSSTPAPSVAATPSASATTRPYRVRAGDTLFAIAVRFHTTVAELQTLNGISNPSRIQIGQEILVPDVG